jgi:hypothetical protein
MPFRFSQEAFERPRQTIKATDVMLEHAQTIAAACSMATSGELVVATVGRDLTFDSVAIIATDRLTEHLADTDNDAWDLIFSAQESIEGVRARCQSVRQLAHRRLSALEKWQSEHP